MSDFVKEVIAPYLCFPQKLDVKRIAAEKDVSLISDIAKYEVNYEDGQQLVVFLKKAKECELAQVFSNLGFYVNEYMFYKYVGSQVRGIRVPYCYHCSDDGTLILESVAANRHISQLDCCRIEDARKIIPKIAEFHNHFSDSDLCKSTFTGWDRSTVENEKIYFDVHCDLFAMKYAEYGVQIDFDILKSSYVDLWMEIDNHSCSLLHNDLRLDNIFWNANEVFIIDWQLTRWGNVVYDLSLFIIGNLSVDDRRVYCEELLTQYFNLTCNKTVYVTYEEFRMDFHRSIACHLLREINYLGEDGYDDDGKTEYLLKVFPRYVSAMEDYRVWDMIKSFRK